MFIFLSPMWALSLLGLRP